MSGIVDLQFFQVFMVPLQALSKDALLLDLRPMPTVEFIRHPQPIEIVEIRLGLENLPALFLQTSTLALDCYQLRA